MDDENEDEEDHPIFEAIEAENLDAVKSMLKADPTVLTEINCNGHNVLQYIIFECFVDQDIAMWVLKFIWQHNLQILVIGETVEEGDPYISSAPGVSARVTVAVVHVFDMNVSDMSIREAVSKDDSLAYLLLHPSIRKNINSGLGFWRRTPLREACIEGFEVAAKLLLAAGADPTTAECELPFLRSQTREEYPRIVAILEQALEDHRAWQLLRARAASDTAYAASLQAAQSDPGQTQRALTSTPACLRHRVRRNKTLPQLEVADGDTARVLEKTLALPNELFDNLWSFVAPREVSYQNTWDRIVEEEVLPAIEEVHGWVLERED